MWIGPVHAAEHTLVGLGVIDTLVGGYVSSLAGRRADSGSGSGRFMIM